jgi:hypothetical protein
VSGSALVVGEQTRRGPVEQPSPRQPDAPVEMLSAPANADHERARQEKEEVSHREVVRAAGDR